MRVFARREQLAEDLSEDEEVVDLAARDTRERLVEEHHALLGPVPVHEARAQVGQTGQLQLEIPRAVRDLERVTEVLLLLYPIELEHAAVQGHPSRFGRVGRFSEQSLCPRQPTAHDRGVTDDHAVHARERPCDADGAQAVIDVAVDGVGPFPTVDGIREVELEVRRVGEAFDHLTASSRVRCVAQDTLEDLTRARRITPTKRGASIVDQLRDRAGHPRIIA